MADEWEARYWKRYETGKSAVFWDLQDCRLPDGLNVLQVSQNIKSALEKKRHRGKAFIHAYGDNNQIGCGLPSTAVIKDLQGTGISGEGAVLNDLITEYRRTLAIYGDETQVAPEILVNHAESKAARIEMILVDMFTWAMKNSCPSNLLLIVGDISRYRELILAFHHLISANHNILLAQPSNASAHPGLPIETKLIWESLSLGEILSVDMDRFQAHEVVRSPQPTRLLLAGVGALVLVGISLLRRSR